MASDAVSSNPEKNAPNRFRENRGRSLLEIGGSWAGTAVIVLIALVLAVIFVLLLSGSPGKTLYWFFLGPALNRYYFGNMINSAIPLIFGGLGVSVAMRGGNYNLGGEGQIYAGAFTAAVLARALEPLGLAGAGIALIAGAALAGLAAAFSGYCRARWNTTELITCFLVSNMLILTVNYLITGPFLDPDTNLQSTRKISAAFQLARILPPSPLSAGIFAALAAVTVVWFFLYRTRSGYELRMTGFNPLFARYGGIAVNRTRIRSMFISGFLYGLGGGFAVFGTYHAVMKEFSAGLGWNGLAVALIARTRPALVIPAALFFAWIGYGARLAMQFSDVTVEIASIVQSTVFFLVTSAVLRDLFRTGARGRKAAATGRRGE